MTKCDDIIGTLSRKDAHIKDNKTAKSTKIHNLWCGEEVQRVLQHQRSSQKRMLMSYVKQHQNRSKEGKEGPKRSMRKTAMNFKIDSKSMRTIVKTDLKLSPLKQKKRQHLPVL